VSALQLADEKLRETGDPAFTPVRAKLSEELAALRAIPQIDTPGISFRLQSLASQVNDWPLINPVPDSFKTGLPGTEAASDDAWSRLKDTVTGVFRSIVSIRESDVSPDVQLSAAQQSLVIESMRAELQLARLTLVSGNTTLYAQSLQRVAAQIPVYFNAQSSAVQAALTTINELQTVEMPGDLPDVSGSLQLLLAKENASAGGGAQQ
jgi:uroporphyrin-3 C-methyltransferase